MGPSSMQHERRGDFDEFADGVSHRAESVRDRRDAGFWSRARVVLTPEPKLGSTLASGVAGRASRPDPFCVAPLGESWEPSGALVVFRKGAENGTRGRVRSSSHSP